MYQRSIGGMLLATAALLAGPAAARAQGSGNGYLLGANPSLGADTTYPVSDYPSTIYPIPTGNPGRSGFYVFSEFNFLTQTRPLGNQVIAFRGLIDSRGVVTGLPGTFIGSLAPALTTQQFGRRTYNPGWTAGIGYKFDDGTAIYAKFTQLLDTNYSAGATLVTPFFRGNPDLSDTFLTSPVFNFPADYAGPSVKTVLDETDNDLRTNEGGNFYGIWNGASEMTIEFTQRFTTADLAARVPLFQTEYSRIYGLGGAKFAWFYEKFEWRTVSYDVSGLVIDNRTTPGPTAPLSGRARNIDVANYHNTLNQRMYGPFVGCGHEVYAGKRTGLSLDLTAAALINYAEMKVKYKLGDDSTQARRVRHTYTVVPNLNADASVMWYPVEGVQMRLGYSAMTFFNTKSMRDPVAFNFGALDPVYDTQAFRIVHGINVGVGLFF